MTATINSTFVTGITKVYERMQYDHEFSLNDHEALVLEGVYLAVYYHPLMGYVPTHTITGLQIAGRGFKKLKDAKAFVVEAGALCDWSDVTSKNCHKYILPDGTPLREPMFKLRYDYWDKK